MIFLQALPKEELTDLLFQWDMTRSEVSRTRERDPAGFEKKARSRARYRAKQIFNWVYQRFVWDWDGMTDLSIDLRDWLKANVLIHRLDVKVRQDSSDGTKKFLWSLGDGKTVESVLIPVAHDNLRNPTYRGKQVGEIEDDEWDNYWDRQTLCISSQVGCAMKCGFCLTGLQGLDRNLGTHEIVAQVLEVKKNHGLTNVVFMGMGEPLHNFDNVVKACQILLDQDGMNFSKRKVTVSTSGLVPQIEKLGKTVDVSLAISLNGTTDAQRSAVMPVNQKWGLDALMKACREYPLGRQRKITFEYVMLKGVNDSLEDADRLVELLKPLPHLINLIPLNEHPGSPYGRPSDDVIKAFYERLVRKGMRVSVRISRGQDILAACGQLKSKFGTARGTERQPETVRNNSI